METVLAMPPQPSPASRMPPANLRVRLKTSPLLRRMFPTRLVLRRAARRANDIFKQSPEVRRETATVMETIVAGTARSDEVAQLAQRYLVERSLDEAYTWQQWASPGTDAESAARLEETLNGDRGVVLSSCHTGPFFTSVPFFNTLGVVPFTVAGPWFFEEPSHDRWGRRLAVWQKRSGSRMILSSGSFPILSALLNRGEVVFLFFDMPGPHETRFLGKPVMLADGSARLAAQTDALVLPLRSRWSGYRVSLDVGEPLDPRDYAGPDELHDALARRHEQWILESPEAMTDPRSFGWGAGATPGSWSRPERTERSPPGGELTAT